MHELALRREPSLALLAIVGLLVLASASTATPREAAERCRRMSLDRAVGNVTAAAWHGGGSQLVLVDRLAGELLPFDREGRLSGEIVRSIDQPLHVQAVAEGLVVLDDLYRLVWLDDEFEPTRSADSRGKVALLDHVVLGDVVFAYGSAPSEERSMPFGFFELAAADLELRRVVQVAERQALDMFSLSRSVVARVGDAAFALDYGPPPTIRRLSKPSARLGAFPAGFDVLPSFPAERGPEAIERFYGVVEQSRVPAQLHGWGRHLYLLTRYPSAESGTVWELHRIDPEKDAVEATLRLPSGSPDLEIVPGEPDWAILEKGRIRLGGRQDVLGVLLLPASWLDGSAPTPLDDENAPDCR